MRKRVIAVVLLSMIPMILIIGSFLHELLSSPDPRSLAKDSPLVVCCKVERTDKKEILTIQDVWKDTRKSRSNLIGLKVNYFATSADNVPSNAVVFYEKNFWHYGRLEMSEVICPADGTIDQFRKDCGL